MDSTIRLPECQLHLFTTAMVTKHTHTVYLEVLSSGIVPTCKVKSIYLLNEVGQKNKKNLKQLIFENLNTTDKISTKKFKAIY